MSYEGGLGRVLSKQGFDADAFVKKVSQGGEDDLVETRNKVQGLADDTAVALKRNVYKNYSQFIETAKEISILEGEMYQLSHMLTEQKSLLTTMKDMSVISDKAETPQQEQPGKGMEDARHNLAFLLEKVEGCSNLAPLLECCEGAARVTEVPGRYLVHNGDLVELDTENFSPVQRVHAFLLNDSIMFATWLPQRRGPVKYRFQSLCELDSLAVVNARDIEPVKNAFKILMFPDTRMYQAESPREKRRWLDVLEATKKKKMALDNQRRETAMIGIEPITPVDLDPSNPFAEDVSEPRTPLSPVSETTLLMVTWLLEAPEDLDVSIAQRDFETAVELINKVNRYLLQVPKSPALTEFRARIEHRIQQLTDVLVHELQVSPERSLRGGPRAARRAVTQLLKLGKSSQACRLFLENREAIIRYNLTQVKLEGAATLYIRKLCLVFFFGLTDTAREFQKAFPDHYGCYSSFIVWCEYQMKEFTLLFTDQVFASNKTNLTTVADCVGITREHCNKLCDLGLELTHVLNQLIYPHIQKVIEENKNQLIEAGKHRAAEDQWKEMTFKSEGHLKQFLAEMADIGLSMFSDHADREKLSLDLTNNTVNFSRSFLSFTDDLCKLHTEDIHSDVIEALSAVFKAQVKQYERALQTKKFIKENKFILNNGTFLVESVLKMAEERLSRKTGVSSYQMFQLHGAAKKMKHIARDNAAAQNKFILNNGTFLVESVLKMAEERLSRKTGVSSYQMFQLHGAAKKMKHIARDNAAAQV